MAHTHTHTHTHLHIHVYKLATFAKQQTHTFMWMQVAGQEVDSMYWAYAHTHIQIHVHTRAHVKLCKA